MLQQQLAEPITKREILLSQDWPDITKKLTAFVIHYLNHFVRRNYKEWNLPNGFKAEDIAYEAIQDVFEGAEEYDISKGYRRRNWDPDKDPDLLHYLQFSVCRSKLSNLLSKAHKNSVIALDNCFTRKQEPEDAAQLLTEQLLPSDNDHIKVYLDGLRCALKNKDSIDVYVLQLMLEGRPARLIAACLGIDVKDVYNAKRRIIRVAKGRPNFFEIFKNYLSGFKLLK